ncbi:TetR/AcrR family transcriptional regulator [Pseudonocardia parietis]|uniref:AcrR family transcriptional regulator n=1 Tax=Pseudonocardia parietis TaxID=570936 RepID=A0ABS4VPV5_9PSEU|nr:TetR/AcrR family transcriptional regulator [Pseudonocardia parietis]MBP2365959.1 AcrR family transcriptional regulator [Pseudonocardia parietis]
MGNREDLLTGARECLREKGYDRTSVRDIATAAGVSMAAIGYHYGSREALLNQALFALLDEGGSSTGRALVTEDGDSAAQGYTRWWESLLEGFRDQPHLWLASVELFMQAQRRPELRGPLAEGIAHGRRGNAGILEGIPEDEVSDPSARTLGMIQSALMSGVLVQCLSDPENAPTAAEVLDGLRALVKILDAP